MSSRSRNLYGRIKCTFALLIEQERSQYGQLIGQLNWITNMTRPEFSFEVCYTITVVNCATISDIIKLNEVLKQMKSEKFYIRFPSFEIESLCIKTFQDASSNNLPKRGSYGGEIIIIGDERNQCCPITWNSFNIRSTLTAEALALTQRCDTSFFNHICQQNIKNISKEQILSTIHG